jgi:hypothetical protein
VLYNYSELNATYLYVSSGILSYLRSELNNQIQGEVHDVNLTSPVQEIKTK